MKPIEEGCTAIVICSAESPNTGKIVVVGPYVGTPGKVSKNHTITATNCWSVNVDIYWGDYRLPEPFIEDHKLQRLDDTDENELVKTEIEEEV